MNTFWLEKHIFNRPYLYFPLLRARGKDMACAVDRSTDFVIASFGGSANSYTAAAFGASQPKVNLAHHLHVPAQVVRAIKLQIPCLVLIRHPLDAIGSVISYGHTEFSYRGLIVCLRRYNNFYTTIAPLHERFVACAFKDVIEDYGAVLSRVNARFQTNFSAPENGSRELEKAIKVPTCPGRFRVASSFDIQKVLMKDKRFEEHRIAAIKIYDAFCTATNTRTWKDTPKEPKMRRQGALTTPADR